ncbi:potassium transporter Kup [Benzoatithermus flavus]|uniref:potassium transporter Kup n=1 Tax=Benzoatithermus flavus TaxID=3108223 RepID=UPI003AACA7D0
MGSPAVAAGKAEKGTPSNDAGNGGHGHADLRTLVIGAIGVVYGDIGTSPLYTLKEAFGEAGGLHLSEAAVLGVLSLVFWSLIVIVTLKYVALILRADNRGEGGVLSMSALALRGAGSSRQARRLVLGLSIAGLALFYGDGLITPAISVLSAVEGLETATPELEPYVLPIATGVLFLLFMIQRFGTASVGRLFGPVMIVWFGTLAVLGLAQIVQNPAVLAALHPARALALFELAGWQAFVALGAIVLAVTGAEALYADMGHFGRTPIRVAWLGLVLPSLVLNYFGQGALVLRDPAALEHPFYHLAPTFLLWPLILLATCATVIASQAVISGVFSLTRQAIQLGYLPRMAIRHTSASEIGQIYLPRVNWLLMLGVLVLVLGFGTSSNLAAAYGISVTAAMSIDAVLAGLVAVWLWGWPGLVAGAVFGTFLLGDLGYVAANSLKIPHGGWFPLLLAGAFSMVVMTWRHGRSVLYDRLYKDAMPTLKFIENLSPSIQRVAGTAVFMTGNPAVVPTPLLHNLRHNKVIHERVVLMTVITEDVPYVPDKKRVVVERLGKGFFQVWASYGFMDEPDVPKALELCRSLGLAIEPMATSYFLGRETLIPSTRPEMGGIEEKLFIALNTTALAANRYFKLPPDRVVELGTQVEI